MPSPLVLHEKLLTLGELIEELESMARYETQNDPWPYGLMEPHAYRGSYACLAFQFTAHVSLSKMVHAARSALGREFRGYKGELWTMDADTPVYVAHFGELGVPLTDTMLGCLESGDVFWRCFESACKVVPALYRPDGERGL